ncbi:TetR/AcrR family transcriptional regulator [Mycolicibacterium sp. HK-90]|uniref:TetR/AcrR family transcriptional regulator n=1 Tax=Mycolicibacterium sp. HK-90 TaxID=3056937 RepID=UPI002659191E|nr:TetR/AcrR family transcriptional regulator [Mycolicibacterium sp. HK-90]WKG05088.1 helix-turn-helix domain-containing protein [Mycolicibacterium sp. HK-90]
MTGGPGRSTLSKASITAVAWRIADEEGLAEVTCRRIARELGTGAASLYRHITDRRQLLTLLAEDLAGGYPLVDVDGTAMDRLAAQWLAMRDYLKAHPWGAQIIAEGDYAVSTAQPIADRCMRLFDEIGLDESTAHRAYRASWHLLIGHLLSRHPFGHLQGAPPEDDDFEWAMRALLTGLVIDSGR